MSRSEQPNIDPEIISTDDRNLRRRVSFFDEPESSPTRNITFKHIGGGDSILPRNFHGPKTFVYRNRDHNYNLSPGIIDVYDEGFVDRYKIIILNPESPNFNKYLTLIRDNFVFDIFKHDERYFHVKIFIGDFIDDDFDVKLSDINDKLDPIIYDQ
jgi:hypothetical protein